MPKFFRSVFDTIHALADATDEAPSPPVPIDASVQDDHIVCLEDGAKLRTLTRYLQRKFGLTPEAYRERWGLPDSYPMCCRDYARKRSEVARATHRMRKAAVVAG